MISRKRVGPIRKPSSKAAVALQLVWYFERNGYVRRQNADRLANEGYLRYKKGDEVRLTACNEKEVRHLQALLEKAGFRAGRRFTKGTRTQIPVYGRAQVRRFLKFIGVEDVDQQG